jgi:hypothetical protein
MIIINKYFEFKCRLKTKFRAKSIKEREATTIVLEEGTPVEAREAISRQHIRGKTINQDHIEEGMMSTTSKKEMERDIRETTMAAQRETTMESREGTTTRRNKSPQRSTTKKRKRKSLSKKMRNKLLKSREGIFRSSKPTANRTFQFSL